MNRIKLAFVLVPCTRITQTALSRLTHMQRAALGGKYLYKLASYCGGACIIVFLKKLPSYIYLLL